MRCLRDALEKRLIGLVRNDRGPLVHRHPNSAQMIPMMMRRYDVPDRLVRNEFLRFREDRGRARNIVRNIDHDNVIFHFDHEAVMCRARQIPHAIAHLLRLYTDRRGREVAHSFRDRNVDGWIGGDAGNIDVQ